MSLAVSTQRWIWDDGGRAAAGYPAGDDCATRALAIVSGLGYQEIRDTIDAIGQSAPEWHGHSLGYAGASDGISAFITLEAIRRLPGDWRYHARSPWGWQNMRRPNGYRRSHAKRFVLNSLPAGRLLVELNSDHVCAVIDRIIHDTWECSRGGRATILGYWRWLPDA